MGAVSSSSPMTRNPAICPTSGACICSQDVPEPQKEPPRPDLDLNLTNQQEANHSPMARSLRPPNVPHPSPARVLSTLSARPPLTP